jgi:hypothetical protein
MFVSASKSLNCPLPFQNPEERIQNTFYQNHPSQCRAIQMVDEENDPGVKAAYQLQAEEFGQTPQQLFTKKHPKKAASSRHSERRRRRPLFWQCLACTALSGDETKED